jgi:hypothetical protein
VNVRLVDIDSKIPNLALMQISAFHKAQGDEVGFDVNDPDRVYISCIFTKNAAKARGVATMFPGSDVTLGGSGLGYSWLPEAMQKIRPDYDLYPSRYSLGFTSRGCIRHCPFCIVHDKEGGFRRWQHPREFADPRFDTVAMLDNNILADKKWFFEVSDWCLSHGLKVDFMQGLDVRLLDEEIAERLRALKWAANIRFAFDHVDDEPAVMRGITLLKAAGINLKHDVSFFVLAGFTGSTFDDALYRCRRLREAGTNAYVMRYARTPKLNALARWANARQLFWSMDFADYTRKAVAP